MTAACALDIAATTIIHEDHMTEEVNDDGYQLSACREYAYRLRSRWDDALPVLGIIALHPGALGWQLDQTITACVLRARQLRFGGIEMGYLFPVRLVDSSLLAGHRNPIGDRNKADGSIMDLFDYSSTVIAAWGNHPSAPERADDVVSLIRRCGLRNSLFHWGFNKDGSPMSPLQVTIAAKPKRWVI